MKDLIDEHFRLRRQLDLIEAESNTRNMLINLCTLKVLSLRKGVQTPPTPEKDANDVEKKLLDYELRVSVLKLQLSTKEKVHEAQIDELKDVVADLRKQLNENVPRPKDRLGGTGSVHSSRTNILSPPSSSGRQMGGRSISAGSTFLSPSRSVFTDQVPLGRKKRVLKLKDTTPIDFGISSILSQASLKLSDTKRGDRILVGNPTLREAAGEDMARDDEAKEDEAKENEAKENDTESEKSDTNYTKENTQLENAMRAKTEPDKAEDKAVSKNHPQTQKDAHKALETDVVSPESTQPDNPQPLDEHSMPEHIQPELSAEQTLLGTEVTDTEDETFHSANNSLLGEAKKKRKKIHLVASEASTVIVPQAKELGVDDENLNSLNYYNDENFKEDNSSPIRPGKRRHSPDTEPAAKKRHVFKI